MAFYAKGWFLFCSWVRAAASVYILLKSFAQPAALSCPAPDTVLTRNSSPCSNDNSNNAGKNFLSENSHSNLISPKQSQNVMSLRLGHGSMGGILRAQSRLGRRLGTFAEHHLKLWLLLPLHLPLVARKGAIHETVAGIHWRGHVPHNYDKGAGAESAALCCHMPHGRNPKTAATPP